MLNGGVGIGVYLGPPGIPRVCLTSYERERRPSIWTVFVGFLLGTALCRPRFHRHPWHSDEMGYGPIEERVRDPLYARGATLTHVVQRGNTETGWCQ